MKLWVISLICVILVVFIIGFGVMFIIGEMNPTVDPATGQKTYGLGAAGGILAILTVFALIAFMLFSLYSVKAEEKLRNTGNFLKRGNGTFL